MKTFFILTVIITTVTCFAQGLFTTGFWKKTNTCSVAQTTYEFSFTGNQQTHVVPVGCHQVTITAYGAEGGSGSSSDTPGRGGSSTATFNVTPGETLYIYVGGQNGYNGGGSGAEGAGNGGGASDVRRGNIYLADRIIVAGGGGGAGSGTTANDYGGGHGGGLSGYNPWNVISDAALKAGGGGTQTAGGDSGPAQDGGAEGTSGVLGIGGNGGADAGGSGGCGSIAGGGGGGGGYYGGGGTGGEGNDYCGSGGGGGGSGYVSGTHAYTTAGVKSGNGMVTISYGADSYTKLLLHGDGTGQVIDSSVFSHSISLNDNVSLSTGFSQFGGSSLYFDGNGDMLTLLDSNDWTFGSSDFTIDFWIRFNVVNSCDNLITHKQDSNNQFYLYYTGCTTPILEMHVVAGGTNIINHSVSWTPSIDAWYHVAVVRSGSSFMTFVNGTQVGSTTMDSDVWPDYNGSLYIGGWPGATIHWFNGYMDELRISKGIARWRFKYTPPTGSY